MAFLANNQEYPISEGRIKLFSYQSSSFTVSQTIQAPSGSVSFGKSVVSQNGKIIVGDPDRDDGKGSVFIYDINGNLLETLTGTYTSLINGLGVRASGFGKKIVYNNGILAVLSNGVLFLYSRRSAYTSPPYLDQQSFVSNDIRTVIMENRYISSNQDYRYIGSDSSVAIGDGFVVIGDSGYNTGSGRVMIFSDKLKPLLNLQRIDSQFAPDGIGSYNAFTILGSEYYSNYSGFGKDIAIGGQRFIVGTSGQRVVRVFNFARERVMEILNPDTSVSCSRYVKIGCGRIMVGGPSSVSVYDINGELQFTKTASSEEFASFNSIDIGYGVIAMAEGSGGNGRVHIYDLNGELLKRNDFGNANITVSIGGKIVAVCKENQSLSFIKGFDGIDNRIQMRSESLNSRFPDLVPSGPELAPYSGFNRVSNWNPW